MAEPNLDDLVVTALNALASSPAGMTMPDFESFLEARQGPTDEAAADAQSPQSRQFRDAVQTMLSGPGGLVERGYATYDGGGMINITQAGRDFVGR